MQSRLVDTNVLIIASAADDGSRFRADAVLVPLDVDEFGAVRNWPPRFFGDAMGEAREQARARAQRLRETAGG